MSTNNNEDYYSKLALPPTPLPLPTPSQFQKYKEDEDIQLLRNTVQQVESDELREKLTIAINTIVASWTEKHDALIEALDLVQKSRKRFEHRLSVQSQNHERALREAYQLQKIRHEQLSKPVMQYNNNRRRSIMLPSNASCISNKSHGSTSSTISSSSRSSSMRLSISKIEEIIDPDMYEHYLLADDVSEEASTPHIDTSNNFELDPFPEVHNCTFPNTPITPVMSPQSMKFPIKKEDSPENEKPLTFACGNGFWDTISHGKTNKAEVDFLISTYLRRGGNTNVAKHSETVKSVKEGYGLIHALIAVKNTSALQRIINAGVNMNVYPLTVKREDRYTPVVLAAKLGYANGVRLLVEHGGVDLLANRGPYGETALHAAVQNGSDEIASYLLRATQNALLDKVDNNGATPLHYACVTGRVRFLNLFIRDCQAQMDPKDNKGETPLHYAVRNQKLKAITKLIGEFGAYPNPYILKQVSTPLDLAKIGGLRPITNYLKSIGAKTTKEMEKSNNTASIYSSNSSTFSGESSISGESNASADGANTTSSAHTIGVRQYLHTKTSQILRGTFDL